VLKPWVFWAILSALPLSLPAQEIEDISRIVASILKDTDKYDVVANTEAVSYPLTQTHFSFWDELTIPNTLWELRYSIDDEDWDFSSPFSFSNNDIPLELIPEETIIPDFSLSAEFKATLSYFVERLDLVVPVYSFQNDSTSLQIQWWVGVSSYQFRLNWEIHARWETLWYSWEWDIYFTVRTRETFMNPAIIWEIDYERQFPLGHVLWVSFAWRYEVWNTQASLNMSYDYAITRNIFMNFSLGNDYQDYHPILEKFDGFEDWWEHDAELGFTWNISDITQLRASMDSEWERNIGFSINTEF